MLLRSEHTEGMARTSANQQAASAAILGGPLLLDAHAMRIMHAQVPGVTPTAGLSGGAYTLTLAQLGWNGTDILSFWRAIVREGKTHLAHGAVGRLNALSVVSGRQQRGRHRPSQGVHIYVLR